MPSRDERSLVSAGPLDISVTLRAARPSDIETLDRIALAAKAHWGYSAGDLARWAPELRTSRQSVLAWPTILVERAGQIAGFAQIDPTRQPWELVSLWVDPAHMGLGLGRRLLGAAVAAAAQAGQRVIHIDSDPHALGFYRACGARLVGTVSAPIAGEPDRVRPQMELSTAAA